MRLLLVLAAAGLLGACNVVVTQKPLFSAADEAGKPVLKPGVWRVAMDACDVDEAKPIEQWPDCAGGAVVSPGVIAGYDRKDGKAVWQRIPFVLASGDPRVAQVYIAEDPPKPGDPPKADAGQSGYGYAGVKPTKLDRQGRIIALRYWLVQCGPPPPKQTTTGKPAWGTLHPLPGMQMKPGDAMCTADDPNAVRRAAKSSEAWKDEELTAHWVRDGEH